MQAVATAAQSQFRILGGLISVSISATIMTRYLKSHLPEILPPNLVGLLLQRTETIHQLNGETLAAARSMFSDAYNRQMYLGLGLAVIEIPLAAMLWTRSVEKAESLETASQPTSNEQEKAPETA